jgi:cysteine desulfurase / selenocysteine lyase
VTAAAQAAFAAPARVRFDVERVRADFPLLAQRVADGRPLVYLDNAATTQKPRQVIDAIGRFYAEDNANIHRGVYDLCERATRLYEGARTRSARFLNAADAREIVFVRGTTEAVNLVAQSFCRPQLGRGDEVLVSAIEHHSNIVPWQMICEERGATLRVIPMNERGELVLDDLEALLGPRTRMLAVTHVSNALGTVNPVKEIVARAHARGVPVLVDGAQAVAHFRVDVRDMGCDFYTVSGHKVFGPTGVGLLYGRLDLLEAMPPYQGGGDMIRSVSFAGTTYAAPPARFEAGTPNIAGAVGLAAALEYVEALDWEAAVTHEAELLAHATQALSAVRGLRIVGTAAEKVGVVSFVLEGAHAHDVGTIVDQDGIAVRTGHHCAQPVMEFFGIPATARASFALYNTHAEVDALAAAVARVREVLG